VFEKKFRQKVPTACVGSSKYAKNRGLRQDPHKKFLRNLHSKIENFFISKLSQKFSTSRLLAHMKIFEQFASLGK